MIPNPCFQRSTDWSKRLNMLLNHNFQPKGKDRAHESKDLKHFLRLDYRTLNLNWRFEEEIPLRTSHTFICTMGSSGAKGVQAFVWLGAISECVLKHLKKWNMMHPKTPSWGKEECQHQDKYYVLTYCTPTTPEASLSKELYLRTHLVSLGGTKAGGLKEWIFK